MADDLSRAFQIAVAPRPVSSTNIEVACRGRLHSLRFATFSPRRHLTRCARATSLTSWSAIFEDAALALTGDREVSDADRHALDVLKRAFELTDTEADAAVER